MGIGNLLRRSAWKYPRKPVLVYQDKTISYKEMNDRVNRLASSLLKMGAKKKDRIAVLLHNSIELFEIYFASAKIGSIFVPINSLLVEAELRKVLEYLSPRFLFVDQDYEPLIEGMRNDLHFIEVFISLATHSLEDYEQYDAMIKQGTPEEPEVNISDNDVMNIILTSGTTGRPKGVMRTHMHNFANVMTEAIEMRLEHADRGLYLSPPYHVAIESAFLRHILMGNTVVVLREGGFDPRRVLDVLSRENITIVQFVPTMISSLLKEATGERYDLKSLRLMMYAGSPMPVNLLNQAMIRFECQFMQFYGLTESGPLTMILRPEDHVLEGSEVQMARLASAGRPVLDYEVRIINAEEKDVEVGEVGEIITRSEAMTIGYWNLPEETERALRGGWLHTGDMGKFDEDGYVFILDRKNDMIVSGGKNIYPREVEEVLRHHDSVQEVAVIGVPDEHWVESVKAVIVLKEGMDATEEELIAFCKKHLSSYKKPRSVEFRTELPKGPTGKILKRQVRQEYWKGTGRNI